MATHNQCGKNWLLQYYRRRGPELQGVPRFSHLGDKANRHKNRDRKTLRLRPQGFPIPVFANCWRNYFLALQPGWALTMRIFTSLTSQVGFGEIL